MSNEQITSAIFRLLEFQVEAGNIMAELQREIEILHKQINNINNYILDEANKEE